MRRLDVVIRSFALALPVRAHRRSSDPAAARAHAAVRALDPKRAARRPGEAGTCPPASACSRVGAVLIGIVIACARVMTFHHRTVGRGKGQFGCSWHAHTHKADRLNPPDAVAQKTRSKSKGWDSFWKF